MSVLFAATYPERTVALILYGSLASVAWAPDYPWGRTEEDLQKRILRTVGEPLERFSEDGLRVLRAARFVATLGFQLEEKTRRAMPDSLDSFRRVSHERVRDEWLKAMTADKPSVALEVMREVGILQITCPTIHLTTK